MRNTHCRSWNMARKLKNVENETQILYNLEYREKDWKAWERRYIHSRTWNMARKLKNVENGTQTLFDLEYGKKH